MNDIIPPKANVASDAMNNLIVMSVTCSNTL